ncbi:beta-galactosidase [Jejuia pallidilutea]|uniref:Beta-galactosidase n=1 Tax=Jejuia pallidilutea TaxID=504487 RepID=A0A362XE27_9FLAO|nr:beta-galactosidase trimerization domain-containing protein [Jejuia pallidilutea]PQV51500.1 beta-galactosidase [Jejuia pallidilutea]
MNKNNLTFLLLLSCFLIILKSEAQENNLHQFGAQVFIEPGQTEQETEEWFRVLKENGMKICRIRMFESYMHKPDGSWDFSLFDRAFKLAEKYEVKVYATFFPLTEKTDIGGWKFPKDQKQLEQFSVYIQKMVSHFGQFKSLYAWVLINEPGGGLKDNDFSRQMRTQWNKDNPQKEYLPNGYPVLADLQDYRFKRYMTSWMLNWIAKEVRKTDKNVALHVNNHAIFSNAQEYDFPYWRTFLTSLGGSAHASWHFGQFSRDEYALAMSANSEIILSGSGDLPWIMTELQGGNNTFSAYNPMCPTEEEITQWLWTVIGTEGVGSIFWSLNARASGIEAGEWALIDFQNKPTDRVFAIKEVSKCIDRNADTFQNIRKAETGVNLLYVRESIWAENVLTEGLPAVDDGRKTEMKDLLGYFQAFSEMGISPNIKAFEEFDFTKSDYAGTTVILANQISIPTRYASLLKNYVENGGTLIIGGLTAFYDENLHNTMLSGFPFKDLYGGEISEFKYLDEPKTFNVFSHKLSGEKWKGLITPEKESTILSKDQDEVLAIRSNYKKGTVIWLPTLLGTYARNQTSKPLSALLMDICDVTKDFRFEGHHSDVLMKTLKKGKQYVTVIINKNKEKQALAIRTGNENLKPKIIFSNKNGILKSDSVEINPEETMVLIWE